MENHKRDIAPRLKAAADNIKCLERDQEPISQALAKATECLRTTERKLVRYAQLSERKLNACYRLHQGAVKFRKWLDSNKAQFRAEVFGPLAMVCLSLWLAG